MLTHIAKEIDFTFCAKSFISLINEYSESYGSNVFVDIVSGSKRKNLPEILTESKYFGIHSDVTKDYLKMCILYLLECNLVSKASGKYSVLSLTSNGLLWLQHDNPTLNVHIMLSEELCGDLIESKNEVKESKDIKPKKVRKVNMDKPNKIPTHIQSYELFHTQNKSLEEVMSVRDLSQITIENHLIECLKAGLPLDLNRLGFNKEKHEFVNNVILGEPIKGDVSKLKPIKEECDRLVIADEKLLFEITYFDIKCAIALMK